MGCFGDVHTTKTLCNGRCDDAPVVISMPDGRWFKQIKPDCAEDFTKLYLTNTDISDTHILYQYGDQEVNSDSVPTAERDVRV